MWSREDPHWGYLEQLHWGKNTNSMSMSARRILRFIKVGFLVMPGAALVFDMPETLFGPNDDVSRGLRISRNL